DRVCWEPGSRRRFEWMSQDAGENAGASTPRRKPAVTNGRSIRWRLRPTRGTGCSEVGKFGWHHDPRPDVGSEGLSFLAKGERMAVTTQRTTELVPVMRERLADLETPVSAFAKLRALGGAFLLESAEGGERMGRFSFIGVAPRETLYFRDGEVSINTWTNPDRDPRGAGWLAAYPAADPIVALREHMRGYRRAPQTGLPRFSGGAVGFVSYEVARRFERLPLARNDPYAPWGLPEMVFGIYDTVVAFDHLRHTLTVLAHDDATESGNAGRMIDRVFAALDAPLPSLATAAQRETTVTANGTSEDYMERVRRARELIAEGDCIQ